MGLFSVAVGLATLTLRATAQLWHPDHEEVGPNCRPEPLLHQVRHPLYSREAKLFCTSLLQPTVYETRYELDGYTETVTKVLTTVTITKLYIK
jgi:hypothetical protein